jgi:acid stress-induced BolA-like protein IbaG/YrbA
LKKVAQIFWSTSVIFEKLPKVKIRALGENSHNLVTLISSTDLRTNSLAELQITIYHCLLKKMLALRLVFKTWAENSQDCG